MSLWTPGGEHTPDPEDLSDEERERLEEMAGQMAEVREQLLQVPASTVVANHAMGLYELAAIHLSNQPPNLEEGRVAIDAMGGIVESLENRLGDNEGVLRDALAQLRLAYVQLQAAAGEGRGPTPES
jgi:hypothetical protein